jgi:hypothetical protein
MKIYSNPDLSDHVFEKMMIEEHNERMRLQKKIFMKALAGRLMIMAFMLLLALIWRVLGN